jgi:hypothetical protein
MLVNREELLQKLDLVLLGVGKRETIPQSKCFCFKDGRLYTWNDEVCFRIESGLGNEICGAVLAIGLHKMLCKLDGVEEIDLEQERGRLRVQCTEPGTDKEIKMWFNMEREFKLAIHQVDDLPTEWNGVPDDFDEALSHVIRCARDKCGIFMRTMIHITPRYMESYDGQQMMHYKMRFPLQEAILVRKEGIKKAIGMGMIDMADTKDWLHFRSTSGVIMSTRKYFEYYHDLSPYYKDMGERFEWPDGLVDCLERMLLVTAEQSDSERVRVEIKPIDEVHAQFSIEARGNTQGQGQTWVIPNEGFTVQFLINPVLLKEMASKWKTCELRKDCIIVRGTDWMRLFGLINHTQWVPPPLSDEQRKRTTPLWRYLGYEMKRIKKQVQNEVGRERRALQRGDNV